MHVSLTKWYDCSTNYEGTKLAIALVIAESLCKWCDCGTAPRRSNNYYETKHGSSIFVLSIGPWFFLVVALTVVVLGGVDGEEGRGSSIC